jgi:hypothetical protein
MARKKEAHEEKLNYTPGVDEVTIELFTGEGYNAEDKKVLEVHVFKLNDLPATLESGEGPKSIAAYGLQSLLQDRTSEVKESARAKLEAMREYFEIFKTGKWREYKEGVGRKASINPLFAQALSNIKKAPLAAVMKRLTEMTKDERDALRALEPVQQEIARLEAEANVDVGF